MQQVRSAKSSQSGRVARRAVDMLLKQTAVSPAYSNVVAAGRAANKSKRKKNNKKRPSVSLSACAGKFMLAGTNPFAQEAMGACIPDGNVASSVRCFVRRQMTVTIGTNGFGYCHLFMPLASDGCLAICSTATFTGNQAEYLSANNTYIPGTTTNTLTLPTAFTAAQLLNGYTQADDRAAFNARIVAAGFSFRYTGTELNRSGQVYVYTHPLHNSSGSVFTASGTEVIATGASLSQYLETLIVEAAREDTHIPLFPINENEMDYAGEAASSATQLLYPWSQGANKHPGGFTFLDVGGNYIGIPTTTVVFIGTAGTTYLINYGQHMEAIGPGVSAFSKSPAESDPVGVKDVVGAMSRYQLSRAREPGVDCTSEFKRAVTKVQADRSTRFMF